jgi:hypothetical protein
MSTAYSSQYEYRGDRLIRDAATAIFTVLIALLGAAMMTVTSSPLVKGASFLWLPAALQLIAGVWLGPLRGLIAGGVGAQAAGVIAYGGWAPADFIMNLVAGGVANSWLPGLMFRWFRIDPAFGSKAESIWRAGAILLGLVIVVIGVALGQFFYGQKIGLTGGWGFVLPLVVLLAVPFVWRSMTLGTRDFFLGLVVAVVSCFLSALIGTWGAVVGGQSWEAAFFATGIGWFLGDTASAILGLYMLSQFTERAQKVGVAPIARR